MSATRPFSALHVAWANRSDRPVRMVFVMIDSTITDELEQAAGSLDALDALPE